MHRRGSIFSLLAVLSSAEKLSQRGVLITEQNFHVVAVRPLGLLMRVSGCLGTYADHFQELAANLVDILRHTTPRLASMAKGS